MRSAELQEAVQQQVLLLSLELPVFPHAVLYQQPLSAAAVVAQGPGVAAASAAAAATGQGPWGPGSGSDIIRIHDPEVGWENPAELKAAKLARSVTRGVIDRELKPNSEERRRIAAVLRLPPNKPLQAEAKALLGLLGGSRSTAAMRRRSSLLGLSSLSITPRVTLRASLAALSSAGFSQPT
uniref:Uncharacterized protein n=1 Tax=Tetradesmus obliquus TaxID=3088 RepID=A0A383WQ58_TETOB|eukprot:jgi/Sobl393_1/10127/SZX79463.1